MKLLRIILVIACFTPLMLGREPARKSSSLEGYLARIQASNRISQGRTLGSLWSDNALFSDLASDLKARTVGDLITIQILESLSGESSASVATSRALDANSGITALPGKFDTSGISNLFTPHSSQTLKGQGDTASKSALRTAVTGRVVALIPGAIVIQADRDVLFNGQHHRVLLRGVARISDITPENIVMSTRLSDLEIEVVGKGVVADSTRPPNLIVRWLFRLLGF